MLHVLALRCLWLMYSVPAVKKQAVSGTHSAHANVLEMVKVVPAGQQEAQSTAFPTGTLNKISSRRFGAWKALCVVFHTEYQPYFPAHASN